MRIDGFYTFAVSISKDAYHSKQETNAALANGEEGKQARQAHGLKRQISFRTVTMSPRQLLESALNGHTFCTVHADFPDNGEIYYTYSDGCYSMAAKSSKFFKESFFVGIDIDETKYKNPQDFIERLSLKPTFWYTSLRNKQIDEKTGISLGARFRLVYVFDTPIRGKYFFRYCAKKLHRLIEEDTEEKIHDDCGLKCDQYYNGTNINDKSINTDYGITDTIYSLDDINVAMEDFLTYLDNYCDYKSNDNRKEIDHIKCILFSHSIILNNQYPKQTIISEREKSIQSVEETEIQCDIYSLADYISKIEKEYVPSINDETSIDKTLVKDAERLSFDKFVSKYKNMYPLIYRTEKPIWETYYDENLGYVKYQHCDEDYIELRWIATRVQDGHHRRSTLFHRCWLRRLIKPNITPNEMFYNIVIDREKFFDNGDHCLDVKCLVRKVEQAFEELPGFYKEKYRDIYDDTIAHCRVKKTILHWTSHKKIAPKTLDKLIRWQFIDLIYNRDMEVKDNLQLIQEESISISLSTLYRYCKSRCIKSKNLRYELFKELHKLYKEQHQELESYRKELSFLEDNGLKISLRTLQNYIKKLSSCNNREYCIYDVNPVPFDIAA